MSEIIDAKECVLEALYDEYLKGEKANWDKVTPKRTGLAKDVFIRACYDLQKDGYLPGFSVANKNGHPDICFLGTPSDELIDEFKNLETETR